MTAAAAVYTSRRDIEVISLVGFAHGVSHFFHLLIPPLFPWLMQEFGLNFTEVGLTMTLFFIISGVGQALAGVVVDRVGARRVLIGGIALFVLAAITLGLAQNYPTLLLAATFAGLGNSVFHPADFTLLNRNVSSSRLGHAFSVHGLSGNLGWALGPVFMTGIAVATNWRMAAFAAAVLAFVALALVFVRRETIKESPYSAATTTAEAAPATFAFLTSDAVWACFVFLLLGTMAIGALQNYAPPVLHDLYGMPLTVGASALTAMLLGAAAGMITGGFLVARSNAHDRNIALLLVAAAVSALAIASTDVPAWSVPPLMVALGFCYGTAGPSRDMLVRRAAIARFGQRSFGRVYGFVYSGLDLGFALAAPVFGLLMDAGRFTLVLGGVALLQGLAVLAALRVGQGARQVNEIARS
jgi:FSR family fosmidomycin resistance protein-like MFS transporter